VKLQFDANQPYQLDAIAAVTDLFEGQPQGAPRIFGDPDGRLGRYVCRSGAAPSLVSAIKILLSTEKLLGNVRTVQTRNDNRRIRPKMPLEEWELLIRLRTRPGPVRISRSKWKREPERPTSIFAPCLSYRGALVFQKFIIVVPSGRHP